MSFETGDPADFNYDPQQPGVVDPYTMIEELYRSGHFADLADHVGQRRYVGTQDREDLAQDTLVHALLHPDLITPEGIRTGYTVTNNLLTDQWRHEQMDVSGHVPRGGGRALFKQPYAGDVLAGTMSDVPDHAEMVANNELVQQLLDGLDGNHRGVVEDIYLGGKTIAQVAEARGIPEGTIKSRLYNGLGKLRLLTQEQSETAEEAVDATPPSVAFVANPVLDAAADESQPPVTPIHGTTRIRDPHKRAVVMLENGYLDGVIDRVSAGRNLTVDDRDDVRQELLLRELEGASVDQRLRRASRLVSSIVRGVLPGLNMEADNTEHPGITDGIAAHAYVKGPITAASDPSERVIDSVVVEGLLNELTANQRATVRMRYFDKMTVPQIAEASGVSESSVEKRLATSLSDMREIMDERGIRSFNDYRES